MSYFEIADYVMDCGSYTSKNFQILSEIPGMKFEDCLIKLNDDNDVNKLMHVLGDNFKEILNLYIEADVFNQELAALESSSSGSETDEIVEKDEILGSGSHTDDDDDEWIASTAAIVKVNNEDELSNKNLVESFLKQPADALEDAETYSSYDESEGDVNSPGESEEDDIRGKKYKADVPVANELIDWSKWAWVVGTRFPSRDSFKEAVRKYAVTKGRNLSITTSNKSRHGRIGVTCVKGCSFKIYLSFHEKKGCYMVKTAKGKHTCQRNMSKNRQLTAEFIADEFLPIFKARPHWPAKDIQVAIKEKFKLFIGKWMAYKAKRCAHNKLHGSMKEHYSKIGSYLEALRHENPSSTFALVTVPARYYGNDGNIDVFFRIFVCFDGVKKGFLGGCRKLLCLDGCFLKTFLGGMLLAAIGRDANDQMYPLAWAVVEDVNDGGKGWTLVSDQQKGLINAVTLIWNNAEHRNYARHIYANWHKKFKGDDLKGVFWKAVRAYCEADYKKAIEEMKEMSTDATTAFLNQNPRCFCRCFLEIGSKSDVIVNNMAETFNGYIIQSRSKHLINMLEDIRVSIMTRLVHMHKQMNGKNVIVCPRIQLKLDREKDMAYKCDVLPSSYNVFQVKDIDDVTVDLVKRTCTCRKWDLTGIPCYHVCAVTGFLHKPVEDFVHFYYTKEMYMKSYEFSIPPLPSERYWPVVDYPLDPPPIKIGPGRPKKNRKKDPHEDPKRPGKLTKHGMLMTCSICKLKGHNKRKCKERGKTSTETSSQQKRPRGRPRKSARTQTSQAAAP
ncbi:hypothetical protein QVD17_32525 [Tagetes erecta]|uniref:SWIM-type domain-containing protein n=1 Tax=Tagetes erecta TaxID=13708 RepID=A0AAD8JVM1_TARER|nr:hypothetical protein QVD17_32525 [Tagetes erecta]